MKSPSNYPASASSYLSYGITRTQLANLVTSLFHFPSEYQDTLDEYYLMHWTGQYFTGKLVNGIIRHRDEDYSVIYQFCTPAKITKSAQVKLSFRKPKAEFNLKPYVIVRILES